MDFKICIKTPQTLETSDFNTHFPCRGWASPIAMILMSVLHNVFSQHVIILQIKHIQNI